MAMSDTLNLRREDGVQILELNRPERHHAINRELADAIVVAMDNAERDNTVRAVIVTGSGEKAFCAGQDMLEASGIEAGAAGGGAHRAGAETGRGGPPGASTRGADADPVRGGRAAAAGVKGRGGEGGWHVYDLVMHRGDKLRPVSAGARYVSDGRTRRAAVGSPWDRGLLVCDVQ